MVILASKTIIIITVSNQFLYLPVTVFPLSVRCESPDSAVDLHSLPSSSSSSSPSNQDLVVEGEVEERTTTATQTGLEENSTDFDRSKLTVDRHCYECHVKYRDPQHKDLVMFLHASKYQVTGIDVCF